MLKRIFDNLIPPSGGARFPALDGLRGLACLLVLVNHTPFINELPFAKMGTLAVRIFFVLSGFLLYSGLIGADKLDLRGYYRRRAWRILPLYYVALLLGSIAYWVTQKSLPTGNIISHLFFAHTFKPEWALAPMPTAWSLGAEGQFYALLPLLALAFRTETLPRLCAAIACALGLQLLLPQLYTARNAWNPVFINWPFQRLTITP